MTATSPYAPPGRNSLLRRNSSTSTTNPSTVVALFLFLSRFWDEEKRKKIRDFFTQQSSVLVDGMLGFKNSLLKQKNIWIDRFNQDDQGCSAFDCAKNDQRQIQSVLRYWFGSGTPDQSQKNLWMIASSSEKQRLKVDMEITEQFQDLLLELSIDKDGIWSRWCADPDGFYGARGKIAAIIVLDQFSRHIRRHHESHNDTDTIIPSKQELDEIALKTSKRLMEDNGDEIRCGMIPLPMYIFALMPFRHASTIPTLQYVQSCIEELATLNTQMDSMLGRFRKATNRRLAVLQDEARRTGSNSKNTASLSELASNGKDKNKFRDEDILETFPFDADMESVTRHAVYKTIVAFLEDRGIKPKQNKASAVIVSLSGGVDSMVIASVLGYLKNSCDYNLNIIAVHIDYGNRPESAAEADFVRRYSEALGIDFQCRRIEEVTRGITSRDDYERISRSIRYDSYRAAVSLLKTKLNDDHCKIGVMLGHHRGDLRENVLSNSHKGSGPLDLSGMTSVSQNDGITLYRPLLPLEKTFIFDYAHTYGIPYFKDTTPHWSTRGKLRNKLLPLLQEIYGEGSMNNLSNLATESDECRELLYTSLLSPFLNQVVHKPMGIAFDTSPWKGNALFFWKFVLREALHSAKFGMFSDKSVVSFLERVQAKKLRSGWLQCKKDYGVYLQQDGRVFVFYPLSFPWNKKDVYKVSGETLEWDQDKKVGPWRVRAQFVSEEERRKERLLQKAITSMDHLMDGKIDYFLESPTWKYDDEFQSRPLVFCQFQKSQRPLSWKNTDLKIQSILPLVCNDEIATQALQDRNHEHPTRLVKVTLRLDQ